MTTFQEQPTNCPECGTDLELDETATRGGMSHATGEATVYVTFACPNPDCPTKESDLAKAHTSQG